MTKRRSSTRVEAPGKPVAPSKIGDETPNPLPDDYEEKPKAEPEAGDDSLEDCENGSDERRD